MKLPLDSKNKECYISDIGCESPVFQKRQSAPSRRQTPVFFTSSLIVSLSLPGALFVRRDFWTRSLTPAGSFFVPAVRGWGKSHNIKPLPEGGMYGDHTHRVPRGLPKRFHGHPSINESSAHQGSAVNQEQSKPQHQSAIRGTCCTHGTSGTHHHPAGGKLL